MPPPTTRLFKIEKFDQMSMRSGKTHQQSKKNAPTMKRPQEPRKRDAKASQKSVILKSLEILRVCRNGIEDAIKTIIENDEGSETLKL